jgi:lipoyl(octanoyl) transferase
MFAINDFGVLRYQAAYQKQLETHAAVVAGGTPQLLLLEHPRVITHGRKDDETTNLVTPLDVLAQLGIDVVATERGGTATYHGLGQLVVYPIFPVGRRVRDFLRRLENVQIRLLAGYGVEARPNPGYAGVYVGEDKIGSIGVAVRQNVALHGLALNINTHLPDFDLIVPCGLDGVRMTSLQHILGREIPMLEVKEKMHQAFLLEFADYKWGEELRGG